MKVLKNELICHFDVDDTLVMWNKSIDVNTINVTCPYTGVVEMLAPHLKHIEILKHQKARGYHVTVWSASGWQWAQEVVKALAIEDWVDVVQTKNTKFFDDLPAQEVLGTRVYIEYKENY
jgi:hydroxymethylpyrimidine pyrophosphatase-like HAD family hydrolase